ncbi:MAG TPA: hypothetical protein VFG10_17270 [Saprospiraceae bacterium]|nr:hypothetical protein [Saprospiraceae bacterium]
MKTILTLCIIGFISCKTAFVSDYSFNPEIKKAECFYDISLEESSFYELTPITGTHSESVMVDDQWVSTDHEDVVGYGIRNDSYNSFLYLMEEALNKDSNQETCGNIKVTRLQHEMNRNYQLVLSTLTLFIPNVFGMPLRVSKAKNTYLFEVYDSKDQLVYRDKHSGEGKATVGFYYGYANVDEKADYDATYDAIEDFMSHFESE